MEDSVFFFIPSKGIIERTYRSVERMYEFDEIEVKSSTLEQYFTKCAEVNEKIPTSFDVFLSYFVQARH